MGDTHMVDFFKVCPHSLQRLSVDSSRAVIFAIWSTLVVVRWILRDEIGHQEIDVVSAWS